ncbi:MAG: hypothetical protein P4L03_04595 [Terracidiphilus sp.]|nr:hypothetical protein [Terracidiphilus sp.]
MTAEAGGNRRARKRSHFEQRNPYISASRLKNNKLTLAHSWQQRFAPQLFKENSNSTFEE